MTIVAYKFFSIQTENIGSGPVLPLYIFKGVWWEDNMSSKTNWNHVEQKSLDIENRRIVAWDLTRAKYYTNHVSKCHFLFDKRNVRDYTASELLLCEFKEDLLSPGSVPELFIPGTIKGCDH